MFLISLVTSHGAGLPCLKCGLVCVQVLTPGLYCIKRAVFGDVTALIHLQYMVGGSFPDELRAPEHLQPLTVILARGSPQANSGMMSYRCPSEEHCTDAGRGQGPQV